MGSLILRSSTADTFLTPSHYWTFGEETGDARWDYVGSAHAMPYADPIPIVDTAFGKGVKPNDGTSISAKGLNLGGSQSFTLAVWAQTTGNNDDTIISSQSGGGLFTKINYNQNTRFSFATAEGTTNKDLSYGEYAGSELKLYWISYDATTLAVRVAINDSSWSSATLPAQLHTTSEIFFGTTAGRTNGETTIAQAAVWLDCVPADEERADAYTNWDGPGYFNITPTPPQSPFTDITLIDMDFISDADLVTAEQGAGTYFLRPYPLHAWDAELASELGDYVWLRSTDHTVSTDGLFIGFSDSPATPPGTWTRFFDASALSTASGDTFSQLETPDISYHSDDPDNKPFYVSAHAEAQTLTQYLTGTIASQAVYQTTHLFKSADLETWEWVGPLLPNSPPDYFPATSDEMYNHTGYMVKTQWGDGTWRAYSLLCDGWPSSYTISNALLEGGGRGPVTHSSGRTVKSGWWSSDDGINWTLVRVQPQGQRGFFHMSGQHYAVLEQSNGGYNLARVFKLKNNGDLEYPGWPIENWLMSEHGGVWIQVMQIFCEGDTAHIYIKHGYQEPNGVIAYYRATLRGELDA